MMRFSIETYEHEIPNTLARLIEITGPSPWNKRIEWIRREANNRFMIEWLQDRCRLEIGVADVSQDPVARQYGRTDISNIHHYELVAFATTVVRLYDKLSDQGKRRLRGQLLDGLKEDKGLTSLQHEMTTAVHLMSRGFDVEFSDIERGGGVDFVARQGDMEIEVECKMFSADIGRKIHRRRCATLCKAIEEVISQAYRSATTGLIIAVTLPDHLTPSPHQHEGIAQAIRQGVLSGTQEVATEFCSVRCVGFQIPGSPFEREPNNLTRDELNSFVSERTGQRHANLMIFFSPGVRTVVCSISSTKPDQVLDGMRRQLRGAAKGQFTGTRPAYIVAKLHDLTADAMEDIAHSDSPIRENATGLQIMTSDFLQTSTGTLLHSVIYIANGRLLATTNTQGIHSSGLAYQIKNQNHPLHGDSRYTIFGSTPQAPRVVA